MTRIIPAANRYVRDEEGRLIPQEGITVKELTPYYLRRATSGDIEIQSSEPNRKKTKEDK